MPSSTPSDFTYDFSTFSFSTFFDTQLSNGTSRMYMYICTS
jgi:hypothetical protein